eukprot:366517-Chlamydomonas_euryale.AAC.20
MNACNQTCHWQLSSPAAVHFPDRIFGRSKAYTATICVTPAVTATVAVTAAVTVTVAVTPAVAVTVALTPAVTFTVAVTPAVAVTVSVTPAVAVTVAVTPAVTLTVAVTPNARSHTQTCMRLTCRADWWMPAGPCLQVRTYFAQVERRQVKNVSVALDTLRANAAKRAAVAASSAGDIMVAAFEFIDTNRNGMVDMSEVGMASWGECLGTSGPPAWKTSTETVCEIDVRNGCVQYGQECGGRRWRGSNSCTGWISGCDEKLLQQRPFFFWWVCACVCGWAIAECQGQHAD